MFYLIDSSVCRFRENVHVGAQHRFIKNRGTMDTASSTKLRKQFHSRTDRISPQMALT